MLQIGAIENFELVKELSIQKYPLRVTILSFHCDIVSMLFQHMLSLQEEFSTHLINLSQFWRRNQPNGMATNHTLHLKCIQKLLRKCREEYPSTNAMMHYHSFKQWWQIYNRISQQFCVSSAALVLHLRHTNNIFPTCNLILSAARVKWSKYQSSKIKHPGALYELRKTYHRDTKNIIHLLNEIWLLNNTFLAFWSNHDIINSEQLLQRSRSRIKCQMNDHTLKVIPTVIDETKASWHQKVIWITNPANQSLGCIITDDSQHLVYSSLWKLSNCCKDQGNFLTGPLDWFWGEITPVHCGIWLRTSLTTPLSTIEWLFCVEHTHFTACGTKGTPVVGESGTLPSHIWQLCNSGGGSNHLM